MKAVEEYQKLRWPWCLKSITRFFGWWASVFALLGPLSVCPFCGQPGCSIGTAAAGVSGGIIATLMTVPSWILGLFKKRAHKKKETK